MSRAGEMCRCISSVRFIFCYPGLRRKGKAQKHAGLSKNAQVSKKSVARHGNFHPAIFAGLLMGLFVKVGFRKIGMKRWRYVDPVRCLIPCYNFNLLSPGPSPQRRRSFFLRRRIEPPEVVTNHPPFRFFIRSASDRPVNVCERKKVSRIRTYITF